MSWKNEAVLCQGINKNEQSVLPQLELDIRSSIFVKFWLRLDMSLLEPTLRNKCDFQIKSFLTFIIASI